MDDASWLSSHASSDQGGNGGNVPGGNGGYGQPMNQSYVQPNNNNGNGGGNGQQVPPSYNRTVSNMSATSSGYSGDDYSNTNNSNATPLPSSGGGGVQNSMTRANSMYSTAGSAYNTNGGNSVATPGRRDSAGILVANRAGDEETEDGRIRNREAATKIRDAWIYKQIRARQVCLVREWS